MELGGASFESPDMEVRAIGRGIQGLKILPGQYGLKEDILDDAEE